MILKRRAFLLSFFILMNLLSCSDKDNFFKIMDFKGSKEKEFLKTSNLQNSSLVVVQWNRFFDADLDIFLKNELPDNMIYYVDSQRSTIQYLEPYCNIFLFIRVNDFILCFIKMSF